MAFDRSDHATLSIPAVKREEGEALSSWLARIARAHLLDLDHVADEIGCRVQLVDHAPSQETLVQIARRTALNVDQVKGAVHPLLTSSDAPLRGELDWRVCGACLDDDIVEGRAMHVRTAWLHPLSTICLKHQVPLLIPTEAQAGAMLPVEVAGPREDRALACVRNEPLESLRMVTERVHPSRATSPDTVVLLREIRDLTDALSVQMNYALGKGAALALFEQPRRNRHITPLALTLPDGLLTGLDPADRLLFIRAAIALRLPTAGYRQEREVLGDWFTRVVAAVVPKGRRRVIADVGMDPLGLLAVALPPQPFHQLRLRADKWSDDFRARWASAEQLAALAGLN